MCKERTLIVVLTGCVMIPSHAEDVLSAKHDESSRDAACRDTSVRGIDVEKARYVSKWSDAECGTVTPRSCKTTAVAHIIRSSDE